MKIKSTITWIFTLLTGTLMLVIFLFIYYFSHLYTRHEFYERLRERALIAAQNRLEQDELNEEEFGDIQQKHQQILPDEQESILGVNTADRRFLTTPEVTFPRHFLDQIFTVGLATFKSGDFYQAGIIYPDNEGNFLVVVKARDPYGQAKMKILTNILILSFLGGVVATYFVGRYYAVRILRPISTITDNANQISISNLHLRLPTNNNQDELDELSVTFNHMLDRLETAFDIQNNFINNASHELRNPLTAILGETEVTLSKERPAAEYRHSLAIIEQEAQRLDLLVGSLLKLAQTGTEDKQFMHGDIRVDEMLLLLKQHLDNLYPANHVHFDFSELPEQAGLLVIRGNQSLIMIALNNLLDNACKFSQNQEVILQLTATAGQVNIAIRDRGVGIPENDLKKITEPFYRAANARSFKGFGIGLPLSQKIINLHGGNMEIQSMESKGTIVKISFPQAGQFPAYPAKVLIPF